MHQQNVNSNAFNQKEIVASSTLVIGAMLLLKTRYKTPQSNGKN